MILYQSSCKSSFIKVLQSSLEASWPGLQQRKSTCPDMQCFVLKPHAWYARSSTGKRIWEKEDVRCGMQCGQMNNLVASSCAQHAVNSGRQCYHLVHHAACFLVRRWGQQQAPSCCRRWGLVDSAGRQGGTLLAAHPAMPIGNHTDASQS